MDGWKRHELALVLTAGILVFSRVFGLSVVLPNFRAHYADLAGPVAIGVGFGAYGLTMALMQLPSGVLSDRFGRKPVLIGSSLVFVVGSVIAGLADSIAPLIAGRLLQGVGAISSVAMAAVGESLPDARRTLGMAMVGIPAGLGFFVGIGAGPALYPLIDMQGLFLLTAAMGLLAILPLPFLRMATPSVAGPHATGRPVLALAAAGFVTSYLLTTTLFFLPTTSPRVLLPMLIVALVAVGAVGRVVDRRGWTWQPIAVGLGTLAAAAPLFALAPQPWLFLGGGLFFLAHATLATTLPSQVSRIAGQSGGRGHGIQNVIAYTGTFVAGPIAGALVARAGLDFALAGGMAIAAALAVHWALRARRAASED